MSAVGPEALIPFWYPLVKTSDPASTSVAEKDRSRQRTKLQKVALIPAALQREADPLSCENLKHAGMICSGLLNPDPEIRRIKDDGIN